MTFAAYEQSNAAGQPVKFYALRWGNTVWYYTSADRDMVLDGATYVALPIRDGGLKQGSGKTKEFTVSLPVRMDDGEGGLVTVPVVALFRATPPSEPVYLVVRTKHAADDEAPIEWIGKIVNIVRRDDGTSADIVTRNPGLRRTGLRLTWSRGCGHFLFDRGCSLSKADWGTEHIVTALTGNSITVDGTLVADPYYNGGFIEWDADGLGTLQRRQLEVGTGDATFRLFGRTDGMDVGMTITLYPGCPGSASACWDVFDNGANYGGVDFMPGKSPFDGSQVF